MDEKPEGEIELDSPPRRSSLRGIRARVRLSAIIAVVLAAAFVIWLAAIHKNGSTTTVTTSANTAAAQAQTPTAVTAHALAELSITLGQPIYWEGPKAGYTYELTRTSSGSIFVRYLPPGVSVGDKRAAFLIVATYPDANAFTGLEATASGQAITLAGGGVAVVDASYRYSVHLAYPNVDFQIEVYDPDPAVALQVAKSGKVMPVG